MKLVAGLVVRNELGRYLEPCLQHLLGFCDEVRLLDDASDEPGWPHSLNGRFDGRVVVKRLGYPQFYENEGRTRNLLLDWTLAGNPTHVLSIDADEFVTDGQVLRELCVDDTGPGAWTLLMDEVWKANEQALWLRHDGLWASGERKVSALWRVPPARAVKTGAWRIQERKLACGREPLAVRRLARQPATGVHILHFGWCNADERRARHHRYVTHDGGQFHNRRHLDSIMYPDRRVRLARRPWPEGLDRAAILAHASPKVAA